MQGDFSRLTYHQRKHFALVLRQQGRVDADADWNEQQAILRHFIETEGIDVIGHSGVPEGPEGGFQIGVTGDAKDLTISRGRIYIEGILCENDDDKVTVLTQPDLPAGPGATIGGIAVPPPAGTYVAYLDVWLRHISAVDDPSIREKALGGPDTASRARVVWQVRLQNVDRGDCSAFVPPAPTSGMLAAQTAVVDTGAGPCVLPPTAGYRRLQNQLYRVEVHNPGNLATATFKWSRENGSVVTSVLGGGQTLAVHDTGRDDNLGFRDDDWIELLDERTDLTDHRGTLLQIAQSPNADGGITIKAATPVPAIDLSLRPRLRRWDQRTAPGGPDISNGVPMASAAPGGWISLEDGLQVSFAAGDYRSGDYWLIPARTAVDAETGNIEWPVSNAAPHSPLPLPPLGVVHAYAPLAVVDSTGPTLKIRSDCRSHFDNLVELTARRSGGGCCTLHLRPEDVTAARPLAGLIEEARRQTRGALRVCLGPGTYTLPKPLRLGKDFGGLTLEGCGGVTLRGAPGENPSEFLDGLIVLTEAEGVTLHGLRLEPLAIPLAPALQERGVNVDALLRGLDLRGNIHSAVGVRALRCQRLTVSDCHFEYPPVPDRGPGFGAGLFAGDDCTGLRVSGCVFHHDRPDDGEPLRALFGALLYPTAVPVPADRADGPALLVPVLDDADLADSRFTGLASAVLVFGLLGAVRVRGNTAADCLSGLWLAAGEALPQDQDREQLPELDRVAALLLPEFPLPAGFDLAGGLIIGPDRPLPEDRPAYSVQVADNALDALPRDGRSSAEALFLVALQGEGDAVLVTGNRLRNRSHSATAFAQMSAATVTGNLIENELREGVARGGAA